jgi:hypothetical protein
VLDDEESNVVTAGAIVTVNVHLTRRSMSSLIKGDTTALKSAANVSAIDAEGDEDKENKDTAHESEDGQQNHPKKLVWQKKKGGGKKSSGKKQPPKKNVIVKKNPAKSTNPEEEQDLVEKSRELKELPDLDDSEDEGSDDGTVSDTDSSTESHEKVSFSLLKS